MFRKQFERDDIQLRINALQAIQESCWASRQSLLQVLLMARQAGEIDQVDDIETIMNDLRNVEHNAYLAVFSAIAKAMDANNDK